MHQKEKKKKFNFFREWRRCDDRQILSAMVVDCVKRPESGRRFDVSSGCGSSLDGVGWWSWGPYRMRTRERGCGKGGGRPQQRVTFLLVIRDDTCSKFASGRTGRGENVVPCSIHGYAMWKLKDRETVPTVDLAEASPHTTYPCTTIVTRSTIIGARPFSVSFISRSPVSYQIPTKTKLSSFCKRKRNLFIKTKIK